MIFRVERGQNVGAVWKRDQGTAVMTFDAADIPAAKSRVKQAVLVRVFPPPKGTDCLRLLSEEGREIFYTLEGDSLLWK